MKLGKRFGMKLGKRFGMKLGKLSLCMALSLLFCGVTVYPQEKNDFVAQAAKRAKALNADAIVEEQKRLLSCELTESELIEAAKLVLRQSNTSYESFKKAFDTSRRIVAALRALLKRKGEEEAVFKEFQLERHGVEQNIWQRYARAYTSEEKIAELEKIFPENEEAFLRQLANTLKPQLEQWLFVHMAVLDYDRRHAENVSETNEKKLEAWWSERISTRQMDAEDRRFLIGYLAKVNAATLKYGNSNEAIVNAILRKRPGKE